MLALSPVTSRKIEDELARERTKLQQDIKEIFKNASQCIPVPLWDLTVREFLQLQTLLEEAANVEPDGEITKTTTKPSYQEKTESRRVTRSMAAKSIPRKDSLSVDRDAVGPVPSTPKFHPGLPETPAAIRRGRGGVESKAKTSNVFIADEPAVKAKRGRPSTIRVTRSTIRASTVGAAAKKPAAISDSDNQGRVSNIGGIVSVELDDGKCFDVDLMDSPSKLAANLGKDAIKEMKDKMQAYAQQLKSFFKRLKVIEK